MRRGEIHGTRAYGSVDYAVGYIGYGDGKGTLLRRGIYITQMQTATKVTCLLGYIILLRITDGWNFRK